MRRRATWLRCWPSLPRPSLKRTGPERSADGDLDYSIRVRSHSRSSIPLLPSGLLRLVFKTASLSITHQFTLHVADQNIDAGGKLT
jgi:hypothetical protein